jgi:hypothetical protein
VICGIKRCAPRAHPTAERAREAVKPASKSADRKANRAGSSLAVLCGVGNRARWSDAARSIAVVVVSASRKHRAAHCRGSHASLRLRASKGVLRQFVCPLCLLPPRPPFRVLRALLSRKSLGSFSGAQNAQSHSLSPKIRSVNPAGAKSGEMLGSKLKRRGRASLEAQGGGHILSVPCAPTPMRAQNGNAYR